MVSLKFKASLALPEPLRCKPFDPTCYFDILELSMKPRLLFPQKALSSLFSCATLRSNLSLSNLWVTEEKITLIFGSICLTMSTMSL